MGPYIHCSGKRVQQLKKRKKSCFFLILKKTLKNVKKRTYSFTGHLITQPLILNYRQSVPVSHQHQTSCSEIRTQETMQLRNVTDVTKLNCQLISLLFPLSSACPAFRLLTIYASLRGCHGQGQNGTCSAAAKLIAHHWASV